MHCGAYYDFKFIHLSELFLFVGESQQIVRFVSEICVFHEVFLGTFLFQDCALSAFEIRSSSAADFSGVTVFFGGENSGLESKVDFLGIQGVSLVDGVENFRV